MIDETSENLTDEQIDSLVADSEKSTNHEIPMSDKEVKETAPEQKTDAEISFEFNHGGKPIKATREQLIKWAQQGYDYPQKMQEFNKQRTEFETRAQAFERQRQEYEAKFAPYQQINEWAEKNPQDWARLQQSYQQARQTQPGIDPNIAPVLQKYESELSEVKSFLNQIKSKEQEQLRQSEDAKLEAEMKSIRDTYKDLDFDTPDNEGKSLDYKVLEYAKANGIRSYKTAFNDFYLPNLLTRAETLAKQDVSKTIQKNSKLGVLGKSSPTQGRQYSEPKNIKNQSYDDLAREALEELRAGN